MKATCFHMRDMNGQKVVGGTLSMNSHEGTDLNAAADHLTNELDVIVMPSGSVSFARAGKPVWVYLSVDPTQTAKGREALRAHEQSSAEAARIAAEEEEERSRALEAAVAAVGYDKAMALLKSAGVEG